MPTTILRSGRSSKTAGRALRVSTSAGRGDLRPGGHPEDAPGAPSTTLAPGWTSLRASNTQKRAMKLFQVPMDRGNLPMRTARFASGTLSQPHVIRKIVLDSGEVIADGGHAPHPGRGRGRC